MFHPLSLYPFNPTLILQIVMRSITERFVLRMLAPAPGNGLFRIDLGHNGAEFAAAMRSVAKWLIGGAAAGAPGIFARFHFQNVGRLLR